MMGKGACSTSFVQASSRQISQVPLVPGCASLVLSWKRSVSLLKKSSQIVVPSSALELRFSWASPPAPT